MEQSVRSNFFKKFKAVASLPPYFANISDFFLKKDFSENPVNLEWESSSNYFNCSS